MEEHTIAEENLWKPNGTLLMLCLPLPEGYDNSGDGYSSHNELNGLWQSGKESRVQQGVKEELEWVVGLDRKLCNLELFTPKDLTLNSIREDEVTAMIHNIFRDSNNPCNISKTLMLRGYLGSVAFNNITRLTFGKRFMNKEGEVDEQGRRVKTLLQMGLKLEENLIWVNLYHGYVGYLKMKMRHLRHKTSVWRNLQEL
ncbi:hypothetical protein HAX54_025641 [Datura stramonium]|uniref:Uncharacterized protein n=1 Tax=Datura stramonium TaxID=4076 RepID=A0ABS8V2P3_DATST|nr:hypothetical protein [Datura stramonium]